MDALAKAVLQKSNRFADVIERHDPEICFEIDRWWQATIPLYDTDASGTVECKISGKVVDGDARGADNALQRDEYEMFYARLVHGGSCLFPPSLTCIDIDPVLSNCVVAALCGDCDCSCPRS